MYHLVSMTLTNAKLKTTVRYQVQQSYPVQKPVSLQGNKGNFKFCSLFGDIFPNICRS